MLYCDLVQHYPPACALPVTGGCVECERNVSAGSELANSLVVTCQVQRDPHQGFTGDADCDMI